MPGVELTRLDYRALKRLMARSSELEGEIRALLSLGASIAAARAPDAAPFGVGYRTAFGVEMHQFPDGVPVGTLYNDDPKWPIVEFGSPDTRPQGGSSPAFHVLERTLHELAGRR